MSSRIRTTSCSTVTLAHTSPSGTASATASALARAGLRAVLNGLLDRYAAIERAGPAERLQSPGFTLRGFGPLPIRL